MGRFLKYSAVVAVCTMICLAGCQESARTAGNASAASRVTPEQISDMLGLKLSIETDRFFEMTNSANRVVIFTHSDGRVYVNSKLVCTTGSIERKNGRPYVSEALVSQIKPWLRTVYVAKVPAPKPEPVIPGKPKPGGGLIVIDPGHGGKDPGAIARGGQYEKTIDLRIAQKVAAILKQKGFKVLMTRNSDVYPELEERSAMANRAGADLYVAIHCDSSETRSMRGHTVYVARSASSASQTAADILDSALGATGFPSKGVRGADYKVLVNTYCPAILIECGYLSHSTEASLLTQAAFQDKLAKIIADSIAKAMSRI